MMTKATFTFHDEALKAADLIFTYTTFSNTNLQKSFIQL